MFILLYGPDDYRREQKKNEILAEFEKRHSAIGLGVFDAQANSASEDLAGFLRNVSIFESKKLAVLQNLFPSRGASSDDETEDVIVSEEEPLGKTTGDKNLADILKLYAESADITVLISEKKKPTKTFAFLLKKANLIQEFALLIGSAWEKFIYAEAIQNGVELSAAAVRFLGSVYQGNSWALATEIQKLSSFGKAIDMKDLDVFDLEIAPNYWSLVNGLKSGDSRVRLFALEKLFALNDPPPKIFNILAASWREKTPQLAAYDRAIKSGKLEYEEALVDIVL